MAYTLTSKSPADRPGFSLEVCIIIYVGRKRDPDRENDAFSGCLVLDHRLVFGLGRAATRTLGKRRFDLLDGFGLGHPLHRRDLARQTIECGLVELALAVGLLGLRFRSLQVAHDFRD